MSAATGIETVYLVDDDPSVLRAISRLLRAAGLQVVTFESGQAFIDAHDPKQRGCVVVDVGLPRMTGLELQQLLRARGSAMAVIFLTGAARFTREASGQVAFIAPARLRELAPSLFDRFRRGRPGQLDRTPASWEARVGLRETPWSRRDSLVRCATYTSAAGELEGYLLYRTEDNRNHHRPGSRVEVESLTSGGRESGQLGEPPSSEDELRRFPEWLLRSTFVTWRVTTVGNGPWWFSSSRAGCGGYPSPSSPCAKSS